MNSLSTANGAKGEFVTLLDVYGMLEYFEMIVDLKKTCESFGMSIYNLINKLKEHPDYANKID